MLPVADHGKRNGKKITEKDTGKQSIEKSTKRNFNFLFYSPHSTSKSFSEKKSIILK